MCCTIIIIPHIIQAIPLIKSPEVPPKVFGAPFKSARAWAMVSHNP